MQLFRTLCVVAVLGALSYGAYVTLTQSPPVEPPLDAANWDSPPRIELPGLDGKSSSGSLAATSGGPASKPKTASLAGGEEASLGATGTAKLGTPHDSTGAPLTATITGVRVQPSTSAPPSSYPTTNAAPTPFDAAGATPLTNITVGPTLPAATGPALGSLGTPTAVGATPAAAPTGVTPVSNNSTAPPTASTIPTSPSAAPPSPAAATPPAAASVVLFEKAQALISQNKPAAALDLLSEWFDNPQLSPADDQRVMQMLDELAGVVVYSNAHLLEPAHVVQPGERIDQIAAKYQITWELLVKINGLNDPWNVQPGTSLKVVRGPFNALVDKSRRRLSLFIGDGLYAGSFAVGFGRDQSAVDGSYSVRNKIGSPLRAIDLGNNIALHTQNDTLPLSTDDAPGCIRLSARDAEDVYDLLGPGSQVIIRP